MGQNILVVVGPTGAGKSQYAMELSKTENIAIISADSRQIYRRFSIGTAKPAKEELSAVLHYGVDIVDSTQQYSAYQWAKDAAIWIEDALQKGLRPVVVGGTGFYIKSLFDPPYDEIPVQGLKYKADYLIVDPGPVLQERIVNRVDAMLEAGWEDEVRALMQSEPEDAIAWKASGYRHLRSYVLGDVSLQHARERTIIDTRQYAKRQRTWFRHQLKV